MLEAGTGHLGIGIYDNIASALAIDALTHRGPADSARVAASTCLILLMPGIDPATFPENYAQTLASIASTLATYPHTSAEPPLACYATASGCPPPRAARPPSSIAPRRSRSLTGSQSGRNLVARPEQRVVRAAARSRLLSPGAPVAQLDRATAF